MMSNVRLRLGVAVLAALMAVFSGGCASPVDNVVPDSGFQACLNSYLGHRAKAPISADMLRGLNPPNGLYCTSGTTPFGMSSGWGVRSLEGAQYLTAVAAMNFTSDGIDDLSPLGGLVNLKSLNVSKNAVTDLSPLDGLDLASLNATDQYLGEVRGPAGKPITLPVVIGRNGQLVVWSAPNHDATISDGQFVTAKGMTMASWDTADGLFSGSVTVTAL